MTGDFFERMAARATGQEQRLEVRRLHPFAEGTASPWAGVVEETAGETASNRRAPRPQDRPVGTASASGPAGDESPRRPAQMEPERSRVTARAPEPAVVGEPLPPAPPIRPSPAPLVEPPHRGAPPEEPARVVAETARRLSGLETARAEPEAERPDRTPTTAPRLPDPQPAASRPPEPQPASLRPPPLQPVALRPVGSPPAAPGPAAPAPRARPTAGLRPLPTGAPATPPVDVIALVRDHVVPALRRAGLLGHDEGPPSVIRRAGTGPAPPSDRPAAEFGDVRVAPAPQPLPVDHGRRQPAAPPVTVHIGTITVTRPTAAAPPPAPAPSPRRRGDVDHAAYLARRRERQ